MIADAETIAKRVKYLGIDAHTANKNLMEAMAKTDPAILAKLDAAIARREAFNESCITIKEELSKIFIPPIKRLADGLVKIGRCFKKT